MGKSIVAGYVAVDRFVEVPVQAASIGSRT